EMSDCPLLDVRPIHSHPAVADVVPVREEIVVVLREEVARLPDGIEEAAVVRRRKIDDLTITRDLALLERVIAVDRRRIHRAPVAGARHRSAQQRPQEPDRVETLMREYGAMHGVPPPSREVAA